MEVEIASRQYGKALITYEGLIKLPLEADQVMLSSFFVCIARLLDGMSYEEFLGSLQNLNITMDEKYYDPMDIFPYLERLASEGVPPERASKALELHRLLMEHYKVEPE